VPDPLLVTVRQALAAARRALPLETKALLENARIGTSTTRGRGAAVLEYLEAYQADGHVRWTPYVYLLLALEQLTELVDELAEAQVRR
jgi:hypothetical protein